MALAITQSKWLDLSIMKRENAFEWQDCTFITYLHIDLLHSLGQNRNGGSLPELQKQDQVHV